MDLTEAEDIKKRWQEYTEQLYKKVLHDPEVAGINLLSTKCFCAMSRTQQRPDILKSHHYRLGIMQLTFVLRARSYSPLKTNTIAHS